MSSPPSTPKAPAQNLEQTTPQTSASTESQPSYVKLAMRNMVRKGSKSLTHFFLTTCGLLAVLVGLAFLTR